MFSVGDIVAVRCQTNADRYWISRVIRVSDIELMTHAMGSMQRRLRSARFQPIYVHPREDKKMTRVPPGTGPNGTRNTAANTAWTDTLPISVLPRFIVASNLKLLADGRLSAASLDALDRLPGTITVAI